jgi:hypothetical protein
MYLTRAIQILAGFPLVLSAPMRNITIAVPDQTIYSTNLDVLCLPAAWSDILAFFSANYLAHAATVRDGPGTPSLRSVMTAIICLFFPAWGLSRAIIHTLTFSILAGDNLTTAARAGALCMVVRLQEWRPAAEESLENAIFVRGYESSRRQRCRLFILIFFPVYKLTSSA